MNEPTPIRIRPKLYQEMEAERPEIFTDTTTWGNYLLRVGLNYHMGLDPCGRLKTERQTERKQQEGREVFYTSKVENIINKEKSKFSKKWIFRENHIPKSLEFCKDLIVKFWAEKSGAKSEEAFNQLIGLKGLEGIHGKYGQNAVKDQLQEGIACKWKSILLKNYEAFGRPKKADQEPVTNHPAGRIFMNGRFVDE